MTAAFVPPDRAPDYVDRFAGPLARPDLTARELAALVTSAQGGAIPGWFRGLFAVRQGAARIAGLKTGDGAPENGMGLLGDLPVLADEPDRFRIGMADRHLDFTIEVSRSPAPEVAFATAIWLHGLPGRIYLTAVMPFHRIILRRFVAALGRDHRQ